MRIRPKLASQPEWNTRYQGWAAKFIAKNMWRCEGYDNEDKFKDLMQDAYIIFRHVLASYPLVTEPKHIMSLFQRAMHNEFHDKAKYKQRKIAVEVSLETVVAEDLRLIETLGENNNEGYLRILISELPPEVRAVLEIFNDEEKLALLRRKRVKSRLATIAGFPLKRESINDLLCKIIRLPKTTDLIGMLIKGLIDDHRDTYDREGLKNQSTK